MAGAWSWACGELTRGQDGRVWEPSQAVTMHHMGVSPTQGCHHRHLTVLMGYMQGSGLHSWSHTCVPVPCHPHIGIHTHAHTLTQVHTHMHTLICTHMHVLKCTHRGPSRQCPLLATVVISLKGRNHTCKDPGWFIRNPGCTSLRRSFSPFTGWGM